MMKTRHDNDMTDHTSAIYAKNNNDMSSLIGPGIVYDENKKGQ